MTQRDRPAEKCDLHIELGLVLAPVTALATKSIPPTDTELRTFVGGFPSIIWKYRKQVDAYGKIGEIRYFDSSQKVGNALFEIRHTVAALANNAGISSADKQAHLVKLLSATKTKIINAIDEIPLEWPAELHGAESPFTVYLKILAAINNARTRLHVFDRYLDADFFPLYMRTLDRNLEVKLITTAGRTSFGVSHMLPISRKVAGEFKNYQLIECSPDDLHDRYLRVDDNVFSLGGSLKDAGEHPMIFAPGDSSPAGHDVLDGIIASGQVKT